MWTAKVLCILIATHALTTSGFVFNIRSSPDPFRNRCRVGKIRMTIHPPPRYINMCKSATVYTWGCKGGCESYSKIDVHNASNVQTYCSCCSQTKVSNIREPAVLHCIDGSNLKVNVKMALACHCRPCSMSVKQVSIFDLRRLLESKPMTNLFGG